MNKTLRIVCFVVASLCAVAHAQPAQPVDRPEDRAALRALLVKANEALNTRKFDAIAPSLHPAFTMVTVDNQKFVGLDAFKTYFVSLFEGPNAMLTKVETNLVVDEATRFLDENTGVVYGTSTDTYHFKDGDVRTMKTRWSAVTEKDGPSWKIVSAHFSANVLDNPVVEHARKTAIKGAVIAGIVGLVLGVLIMLFVRRGKR